MNELALTLIRTLGGLLERAAERDPSRWGPLIADCGGDPAALGADELAGIRPDTEALAVALASEPETLTESWVLEMLGALGLTIAEIVRFAEEVERRTGARDLAWRALEGQLVADLAAQTRATAEILALLGLLERRLEPHPPAEPGEQSEEWSVRWASLRALANDPGAWLSETLTTLPDVLPTALGAVLGDTSPLPIQLGAPRPELTGAIADAGLDASRLRTEVGVFLPALLDAATGAVGFEALAGFFRPGGGGLGIGGVAIALQSNAGLRETFTRAVTDDLQLSLSVAAEASLLAGAAFLPSFTLFGRATGELGVEGRLVWAPAPPTAESEVRIAVVPVLDRLEAFARLSGTASTTGALTPGVGLGFSAAGSLRFDVGAAMPIDVVDASLVVPWSVSLDWDSTRPGSGLEGGFTLRSPPLPTLTLGPLSIAELTVGVAVTGAEGTLDVTFGAGLELGPLVVRAAGLGASATVPLPSTDDGAREGLRLGFIPPTALEISADSPPMLRGGGAILFEDRRYAGFLTLQVYDLAVTALGLLEVDLPAPGPSFSLFVLVSAQFPGIQIGYGFSLNGLGGLVGIHRTIDADALRGDVSSGSVSAILDPGAEMDRAIELLARMARYFPTRADRFVIGLAVQLRWVELVRLDIGVLIELPGPAKIVVLGRARIAFEADGVALVRIQLEVLGIIDFEEKLLSIDAALRDSNLLEIFDITGGAAVRVSWGERPYALMSVGGFHPEFVPEPAVVPVPDRVGLSTGEADDWFTLRLETYFAVTTSSFQLGAAVEVRINLEIIVAEGGLGFDALIVFDPFYFSVAFFAHFRVKIAGISLVGVAMRGTMSGPGPVTFAGEISVEILFITVSWSGAFSIGSEATPALPVIDSVLDRVLGEVRPEAVRALAAALPGAVVRAAEGADPVVSRLDPAGGFEWTQGLVPFGVIVERLQGSPLARPLEVRADAAGALRPAYDWFAAASFAELSDAEALTRKTFERLEAGIGEPGTARAVVEDGAVERALEPEVYVLPHTEARRTAVSSPIPPGVLAAALGRVGRQPRPASEPALGLGEERWTVARGAPSDADPVSSETAAHQRARHHGGVAMSVGDVVHVGDL